jgi:hypothetical protein
LRLCPWAHSLFRSHSVCGCQCVKPRLCFLTVSPRRGTLPSEENSSPMWRAASLCRRKVAGAAVGGGAFALYSASAARKRYATARHAAPPLLRAPLGSWPVHRRVCSPVQDASRSRPTWWPRHPRKNRTWAWPSSWVPRPVRIHATHALHDTPSSLAPTSRAYTKRRADICPKALTPP